MRHDQTEMSYMGRALRRARNGKGYWVSVMRCQVCGMTKHLLANAMRGKKAAPCAGRP